MQRSISRLSKLTFDVAVVGGGVYGACVAREAALRGLTVALVDQGDFGGATSANSQRIIHGGLRYLQHADLKRMRQSIWERSTWMRIAPHLVFPMAVLIPTYTKPAHEKGLLAVALKINDVIGFDRNRHLEAEKRIPLGRMLSKADCLAYCPGLDQEELNGAALFYDAQARNSERLTLSVLLSAAQSGAVVANYAQVVGFLKKRDAIESMTVRNVLSEGLTDIRASIFVNCAGPWTNGLLELAGLSECSKKGKWLKAMVLMTRQLVRDVAVGVKGRPTHNGAGNAIDTRHRYFFISPWKQHSMVGTLEIPYDGDPQGFSLTEEDICSLIKDVNWAYPAARLARSDVKRIYGGLVPADESESGNAAPAKHYSIEDHATQDGVEGLISVVGVKYTTARHVAEKTVDLVERKLRRRPTSSLSSAVPVSGGTMKSFEAFLKDELSRRPPAFSEETIRQLIHNYGSEYRKVLGYCEQDSSWAETVSPNSPVIKAQILHAVREEMACKLEDILYRRTELGAAGEPDESAVDSCAEMLAGELRSCEGLRQSLSSNSA